jgi:predicted NBD/HSP70 family sugar kinase
MPNKNVVSLKSFIISFLGEAPRSLAVLKETTQVSLPTIRLALQELSDDGWVCPVGQSSSTGGRRATLYGLNGNTHLIVGVHLEIPALNMVVSNLDGQIIDRVHLDYSQDLLPDEAVNQIIKYIRKIKETYSNRKILGLGLATPGFIDQKSGKILFSIRAPHWQNFPLKDRLENELGFPVMIENDVDCMTVAELANADFPDFTDILYLGFTEGVKVSMLLNGQLIKGPFGNAGMIGLIVTSPNTSQEIASVTSICREFDQRVGTLSNPSNELQKISELSDRSLKFRGILDAIETEIICKEIIYSLIDVIAQEISRMIQILHSELLIIGGALSHLPPKLQEYTELSIRNRLPLFISNHLLIRYATMVGARVAATGAAIRFLQMYQIEPT